MTAFPRVIHKGLGVYWGVSHRNSSHSMSQAAWVALVFGFTSLCIYLCYRSYTKTTPPFLLLAPGFHLSWGSGIVYRVILYSRLHHSVLLFGNRVFGNLDTGTVASSNHARLLSGEGPIPVRSGSVSTGIDPMHRGPASLEGPPSLLSQQSERSLQGLYRD